MTRRKPRITTVEEADAAMERLKWLRSVGHPRGAIAEVFEAYAAVRADRDRLQTLLGEQKKPSFAERVEQKRRG